MMISQLGEFGLIDRLSAIVRRHGSRQTLLVGIGDDAAAWPGQMPVTVATTDSLVQDVHFASPVLGPLPFSPWDPPTWRELGWKALAVNVSDIAAMGALPQYALVALALPGHMEVEAVEELYEGMCELAEQTGVEIAGGNLTSAATAVVTLSLMGVAPEGMLLRRSAARAGDLLAVTGHPGLSAAGCRMLARRLELTAAAGEMFRAAHLRPRSRVCEARKLLAVGVRAAIDISDGLLADLGHVCQMSGVSAVLDAQALPLHPLLIEAFPEDARELALSGGEDYEILFAAPSEVMGQVAPELGCPVTVIGRVTEGDAGKVTLVDGRAGLVTPRKAGWDHFSRH